MRRLARRIHLLAQGDYSVRLEINRQDELGRLADDFNHLAAILERTDAMRREGMASVSHELRTPLALMIARVEAMQDGVRPLDPKQLGMLAGSMHHLSELVNDLFQLALADVGEFVCRQELLDWGTIIEEALDALESPLSDRGITVQRDIRTSTLVRGDPVRLRQVVTNLLENCARYTEENGAVTVKLEQKADKAILRFADSGPGVDDATLQSLFERFFRADASRSRKHGGAGLGLSLVKVFVEAHNGEIRAFHAPEGGLGFEVVIPLARDA